jgi:hypothetical protein
VWIKTKRVGEKRKEKYLGSNQNKNLAVEPLMVLMR